MDRNPRAPHDAATRPAERPVPDDFDIERALWDQDYRRRVLDAIRRARETARDTSHPSS